MDRAVIHKDDQLLEQRLSERIHGGPTGLVLIRLSLRVDSKPAALVVLVDAAVDSGLSHIEDQVDHRDIVAVTSSGLLAVARPNLTAPAETEGLALRLRSELERHIIVDNQTTNYTISIGTAVSVKDDTAVDLFRYARHALDDAQAMGGNRVTNFEDSDRALLLPAKNTDHPGYW